MAMLAQQMQLANAMMPGAPLQPVEANRLEAAGGKYGKTTPRGWPADSVCGDGINLDPTQVVGISKEIMLRADPHHQEHQQCLSSDGACSHTGEASQFSNLRATSWAPKLWLEEHGLGKGLARSNQIQKYLVLP
ncbi:hypothetical protein MDA_GLEAN10008695 [Myotis davidii]|uniref:Uncharacterized protein n=1 Tax=Myotis davidii TaxID=225400 RepID=L5LG64_MYODS|nr:hypothetical protein MDA_GLEAN10008695 [Myotis davidii]